MALAIGTKVKFTGGGGPIRDKVFTVGCVHSSTEMYLSDYTGGGYCSEHDKYWVFSESGVEVIAQHMGDTTEPMGATTVPMSYETAPYSLEKVVDKPKERKNMIQSLTGALKRHLSKPLQKQYKAGLINGELGLTTEGKDELLEIAREEFAEQFSKRAEEIIEDAKEDKK